MTEEEVPVHIEALLPTPQGVGVFLGNKDKVIAIFVDPLVAAALTLSIQSIRPPRPLTHDLLANILKGLGVKVRKILINALKEDTFYARIHLLQENELGRNFLEIDARPSDSMVLAVRERCPIHVARSVWERAEDMRWALEQAKSNTEESGPANDADPPDSHSGENENPEREDEAP